MRAEKPVPEVLDVELLPTTGGEMLVKYILSELGTVFELTHGLYGQVFDFSDGESIVYAEDGVIISLHGDNSLTIFDDGEVDDVPCNLASENVNFFDQVVRRALRGTEKHEGLDY
jgi:hypothetical protein